MKSVTIKYGLDEVTKQFNDDATFASITSDSALKAVLGYGDNIRALVNGVEMPANASVASGSKVVLETRCNTKAADQQHVTVKYGLDSVTRSYDVPVFVSTLRADTALRAFLGYGDNVRFLMNGVELPDSATIANGSVITVETRCNTKAS